jgi:hypothetical protein
VQGCTRPQRSFAGCQFDFVCSIIRKIEFDPNKEEIVDTEKNMNEENSGAAEGTDTVDEVVEVKAGQNTEEPAAQEMPAAEPETP